MILKKKFYNRATETIAQQLLGAFLVHDSSQGRCVGRIVETEAYLFKDDPACHAHKGMTKRNAAMFGPAGRAYVYLIYGMYHCFNVVTGNEGEGEAVLVRALEPIEGIELMEQRRKTRDIKSLCSGPGKLVLAMGIDASHNERSLLSGALTVMSPNSFKLVDNIEIISTTRVGISKGDKLPLRFYVKGSEFVSRK